ncbi:MAG: hypothetical protein ACPKMZ_00650 [Pleomorphochaeta sp.]
MDKVNNICTGENHTLLIDTNKDCYSVGANTQGQLGNGEKNTDKYTTFTKVELSDIEF